MRIIAGSAKGHTLKVPKDVSRPTTDRVRESLFGILSAVIADSSVLDLFAGSGALGLEALSRGARECLFIDQDRGAVKTLDDNVRRTGLKGARTLRRDVFSYLKGARESFDLVFADPPYADGSCDLAGDLASLSQWGQLLRPGGYLLLEQEARSACHEFEGLDQIQERVYGRSRIIIYERV